LRRTKESHFLVGGLHITEARGKGNTAGMTERPFCLSRQAGIRTSPGPITRAQEEKKGGARGVASRLPRHSTPSHGGQGPLWFRGAAPDGGDQGAKHQLPHSVSAPFPGQGHQRCQQCWNSIMGFGSAMGRKQFSLPEASPNGLWPSCYPGRLSTLGQCAYFAKCPPGVVGGIHSVSQSILLQVPKS